MKWYLVEKWQERSHEGNNVCQVDQLGRFVLPMELHRDLEIGPKDGVEIYVDGEYIVMQKHVFQPRHRLADRAHLSRARGWCRRSGRSRGRRMRMMPPASPSSRTSKGPRTRV